MESENNDYKTITYLEKIEIKLSEAISKKAFEEKDRKDTMVGMMVFLFIDLIICFVLFLTVVDTSVGSVIFYIFCLIAIMLLVISIIIFFDRSSIKKAQIDIELANEEKELYEIRNEEERILADKQFKIHQKELKRYYDLNLSQIKFLSVLGIILILFGVLVVIGSIAVYILVEVEMFFFIVSIICGVLIDCIGAFFISMYTENMKVTTSLHSKLAGSNNLLLASLIVSKIENKEVRENALVEISKNISTSND